MARAPIDIFTASGCPRGASAKQLLREGGYGFTEHDVSGDPIANARGIYSSGRTRLPQILLGDYNIDGPTDLSALMHADRFELILGRQNDTPQMADIKPERLIEGARHSPFGQFVPTGAQSCAADPTEGKRMDEQCCSGDILSLSAEFAKRAASAIEADAPNLTTAFARQNASMRMTVDEEDILARIVEAAARGPVDGNLLQNFYSQTRHNRSNHANAATVLSRLAALNGLRNLLTSVSDMTGGNYPECSTTARTRSFEAPSSRSLSTRNREAATKACALVKVADLPDWLKLWPTETVEEARSFYSSIISLQGNERDPFLAADLPLLMMRVAAIAARDLYLATDAGWHAYLRSDGSSAAIERINRCYAVAAGLQSNDWFVAREQMALRLAWLAAQTPFAAPARFTKPIKEAFTGDELAQLIAVSALSKLASGFTAISRPSLTEQITKFARSHEIEGDILSLRYPLPERTAAKAQNVE